MKKIIQDCDNQLFLEKFKGAFAQVWLFDITHKRLVVRLTMPNKSQTDINDALYILGISCEYITGPFSWSNSNILIKEKINSETQQTTFIIEDEAIGFTLITIGGVGLAIGPESEIDHSFDNFLRE